MSESLERFPCLYTFKVFGRHTPSFAPRVRDVIVATLDGAPVDAFRVRPSSQRTYVSVTVRVRVETRHQLERVYSDLDGVDEVLFCL